MKIAYLKMTNFMLYKKFNRKFVDKDIIGIICEYKNNKTKSNRGGKSTIMEAIKYALHGSSRAKKETHLIHHGEEHMEVEIGIVDNDGTIYKIRRGRDYKNRSLLELDWLDKKKEAQEAINELIGCNGKEFELTNFFNQSDINQFMELRSQDKKEYLMTWLKNTHWLTLSDAVTKDLKEKNDEFCKLRTKKETLIEDLGDREQLMNKIKTVNKNIKKKNDIIKKIQDGLSVLRKKHQSTGNIDELQNQIIICREDIKQIYLSIEDQHELIFQIRNTKESLIKYKKKKKKFGKWKNAEWKKSVEFLSSAAVLMKERETLLYTMNDKFCGVCPILNEGCDRLKYDKNKVKQLKKEIKELDSKCQQHEKQQTRLQKAKNLKNTITGLQYDLNLMEKDFVPMIDLEKKKRAFKAKLKALKESVLNATDHDYSQRIEDNKNKLDEKQTGLDGLNQKLGQYQSSFNRIEKAKDKVLKIDEEINALETEIENLKYLAFMFGKNGIPSQEIENAFQEIEDEINFILEKMGTQMEVSFNADRELGQWEEECVGCGFRFPKGYRKGECEKCAEPRHKKRKDELHLSVLENGNETNFEMESGGGKTFISLATRIALTKLKQRQTGSNFNVLFLDEIDSALDEDARERIMKLVTTMLMKHFGFQQIFWVSHNKKIKENVPHTLKVIRMNNKAKTRWV